MRRLQAAKMAPGDSSTAAAAVAQEAELSALSSKVHHLHEQMAAAACSQGQISRLQEQYELAQQAQERALALGAQHGEAIGALQAQLQLLPGHQQGSTEERQEQQRVMGGDEGTDMDTLNSSLDDVNQRLFELRVELQNAHEELSVRVRALEGMKEDVEILEESRKAAAQRAEIAASEALEKVSLLAFLVICLLILPSLFKH
jgi:hypothetical protein